MSVPFHKQLDPNKQAGQIVFSPGAPNTTPTPENLTLAGYIKTVKRAQAFDDVANEKKLTFDEWFTARFNLDLQDGLDDFNTTDMLECWAAALKQGKL